MKIKKLLKKTLAPLLAEVGFIPARTRRRNRPAVVIPREEVQKWAGLRGIGMSEVSVRDAVARAKETVGRLEEGGPDSVRMAERIQQEVLRICCEHLSAKGYGYLADGEVWLCHVAAEFPRRQEWFSFLSKVSEDHHVVDARFSQEDGVVEGYALFEVSARSRPLLHGRIMANCGGARISYELKEYRV